MSTVSGRNGRLFVDGTAIGDLTAWRFTTTADSISYASSATGGFRRRLAGARHGFGVIAFVLDLLNPATLSLAPGDLVSLQLDIDSTHYYQVSASIDTVQLAVEVNQAEPVAGTADFSTNGAWIEPEYS
jgi:hypothetical protein